MDSHPSEDETNESYMPYCTHFCILTLLLVLPIHRCADAAPPNILFAIADDLSFPHMSAYGTEWVQTPAFDRVARDGLLFNRCYTPNAKCAPSRACILTGRNSWQLEQAANHWCYFPPKFPSYVEILEKHGYSTGMTGKGWAPGIALNREGQRRQMTGHPYSKRKKKPPTTAISNNDYAGNLEAFLDAIPQGKPFCFWYGATEPHRRYEYMSGVTQGNKRLSDIDHVPLFWPDNEVVRHDMLDYALEVEHFDHHLEQMLTELESRGLLDNTLVVVTADNGMPFPRVKGQEYEMSNHLPLAIMWADGIRRPGRTIDDLVSFIDFAPTFLELAGVDWQESGRNVMSEYKILKLWDCENQRHVLTYIDNSMHNLRNWNAVLEWDRNDSDVIILFGYFIDKMDDETGKPILSKTSIETWNDFPIIDADGKFKIEVVPCNDALIDLYNKPVHVDLPAEIIKPKRENKYAY